MKVRNGIAMIAFLALLVFTCTAASVRKGHNHSIGEEQGELFFVTMTNFSGGSLIWTNEERFIWYPAKITSIYSTAQSSTNTFTIIHTVEDQQFLETQVVTNEFGNVQTNFLHQLTNTVVSLITNTVITWTNIASTAASGTTENDWIERGDVVSISMGITSNVWLRYSGRR